MGRYMGHYGLAGPLDFFQTPPAAPGPGDLERFASQAITADQALSSLTRWAYLIKAKEAFLGQPNTVSKEVFRFSEDAGPRTLSKAIDEGSFERLRALQNAIINITNFARQEMNLEDVIAELPISRFVNTVIVGSVIDFGMGAQETIKQIKATVETTRKVAERATSPWGMVVISLIAVTTLAVIWRTR